MGAHKLPWIADPIEGRVLIFIFLEHHFSFSLLLPAPHPYGEWIPIVTAYAAAIADNGFRRITHLRGPNPRSRAMASLRIAAFAALVTTQAAAQTFSIFDGDYLMRGFGWTTDGCNAAQMLQMEGFPDTVFSKPPSPPHTPFSPLPQNNTTTPKASPPRALERPLTHPSASNGGAASLQIPANRDSPWGSQPAHKGARSRCL